MNINLNLHIFFSSIIYPTIIYYLGTRSNEIFLFYLVLIFFFIWKNVFVSYFIGFLTIILDYGNGLVFLLFISFFYLYRFFIFSLGLKKVLFVNFMLILLLISFESYIQSLISSYFKGSGISFFENMGRYVLDIDKNFYYPNYFKLIISYISFIFLSPGYVKSLLLIILMSFLILYCLLTIFNFTKNRHYIKIKKSFNKKFVDNCIVNSLICILFVTIIVLILPTHSFIRYYLFICHFYFLLYLLLGFKINSIILSSLLVCRNNFV